jgi:hypothetical protein
MQKRQGVSTAPQPASKKWKIKKNIEGSKPAHSLLTWLNKHHSRLQDILRQSLYGLPIKPQKWHMIALYAKTS